MTATSLLILSFFAAVGCTSDRALKEDGGLLVANRPPAVGQATPIARPGLPNFHRVSDRLYRGAQPSREGFAQLAKLGIQTVVNLRSFHSDREHTNAFGLGYEHIFMKAWNAEDEEVVRFLRIVGNPANGPVFVHCQHGADRTGTMVAIYRIAVEGWSKQDALAEMTQGEFGYHSVWANLVDYVEELDIDEMKRRARL